MKVAAFVPIKLNSERVPGKNIKKFSDGTPLAHLIQKSLLEAREVDEVYVYCSKSEIKSYLLEGVHFLRRDPKYDTAAADVNDMFYEFSKQVPADIYVLAHATAPFQRPESIDRGVLAVKNMGYDSALAVRKMQDFFWIGGKPFNYDPNQIPRTQDLEEIYMETTGMYIFTHDVITRLRRRIGDKPYLVEMSETESVDINNPIDFEIADAVYTHLINKTKEEPDEKNTGA